MHTPDPFEAAPTAAPLYCPVCAKTMNTPGAASSCAHRDRRHPHSSLVSTLAGLARAMAARSPGLFLRELIAQPGKVGAVWPSSTRLAQCMAAQTPLAGSGLVIELGGGTGAITQALLAQGLSRERLLVVERSPAFVRHLRQGFPSVQVIHGDAARLAALLPQHAAVDAIVSSLPLRSLPRTEAQAIIEQWRRLLPPGGALLQFSYALQTPVDGLPTGFALRDSHLIWRNLPPARVMRFERTAPLGH